MTFKKKLALLSAVLVVLSGAGYWFALGRSGSHSDRIDVSGNIEVDDVELSFKIPGRVDRRCDDNGTLIEEGMPVQKGHRVAELDSSDLELEVAVRRAELDQAEVTLSQTIASRPDEVRAAEAAVRKAEWNLALLKSGFREEEIQVATHAMLQATAEKNRVESDFLRAKRLVEAQEDVLSQEEFDRAKAAYEVAVERLNEADWQLRMFRKGTRDQQIEAAQAALEEAQAHGELVKKEEKIKQAEARRDQAQAALRLAETRLGYATLRSPLTGLVLSENVEPGEYVAPGTPVLTVGNLEKVWLRAYIDETDLGRVKQGQEVRVRTDTYPKKVYPGRVSFIASQAEFTPKNVQTQKERVKLVYRIKIDVPNPDLELKPGMPADAEILVGPPWSPRE